MRRTTASVAATAGLAAALTFGTAHANQASTEGGTPVVNKAGHVVSSHAAKGRARATEARAQHEAADEPTGSTEPAEDPTQPAEPTEDATAIHAPDEHAGTHPDTHALPGGTDHGQDGLEHGEHAGEHQGHGPDEHAGDHPDQHATGPSTEG